MVFTPLLASACVGTIEPRSTALSLLDIQKALREPQNYYFNAKATSIDTSARVVRCVDETGLEFTCNYDSLAIATGSQVCKDSVMMRCLAWLHFRMPCMIGCVWLHF